MEIISPIEKIKQELVNKFTLTNNFLIDNYGKI